MRRFVVALVALLVGGVVLLLALVLNLNRLIPGQRQRILQFAQAALGRPVSIAGITASVLGGIGLRLDNVQIADDPRFSSTAFVRVAAVTAHAELWPLLHGRLQIGSVDMQQPEVHLIRDAAGNWNYATLKPLRRAATAGAPGTAGTAAPAPGAAAVPLLVSRAALAAGTLVLTDRRTQPPTVIRLTRIDATLRNLGTSVPIDFSLALALQSPAPNIALHGSVGPLAGAAGRVVPITLDGRLGPFGARAAQVEALHVDAVADAGRVRITQARGRTCGGTFTLRGAVALGGGGSAELQAQIANARVEQLLQLGSQNVPVHVDGLANISVDVRGPASSPRDLTGTVTADVRNGVLKDFNLVDEVVSRASGLPSIGTLISANVKPKYARLFDASDTRFERLHARFQLGGRRAQTNDLTVIASDYGVRAAGWVGFDRQIDLTGNVALSQRLSRDVIADLKEARYLADAGGQITVPFRWRGTLGKSKPKPDTDYLIAALARALTHGGAADLMEKLLGGKQRRPTPGTPQSNPIERGLRKLLKH